MINSFDKNRIYNYEKAHSEFPNARRNEIKYIEKFLNHNMGNLDKTKVLELGSGNGYLTKKLKLFSNEIHTIDAFFKTNNFSNQHFNLDLKNNSTPIIFPKNKYDLIISLATIHHILGEKNEFTPEFINLLDNVTKKKSYLFFQDVPELGLVNNADISIKNTIFTFNEVVEKFSRPDHRGIYIKPDILNSQLFNIGFKNISNEFFRCDWCFNTKDEGLKFIKSIFNLHIKDMELKKKIENNFIEIENKIFYPWNMHIMIWEKNI